MTRRELLQRAAAAAPAAIWDPPWARFAPRRHPRARLAPRRHPLALVTADTEAHVVVVSLATGAVRRRVATLEQPRSIEACPGGRAVVGHPDAGAVTLLDAGPVRVRRVLRGFGEPRYTAVAPGGRHAYVTDAGHGEVAVIDLERGRVVRRAEVGALARHVTLAPSGRTLWVSLGSSAEAIAVVDVTDPERPRLVRYTRPPFLAHDVACSPDGRRLWVTAGREPHVAIYGPHAERPLHVLDADEPPQHVSFAAGMAYVASGVSGTVRVHDERDGSVAGYTGVPRGSYNVQAALGRVLTPSLMHGTLTVLDARARVVRERRVAPAAHDACAIVA